MMIENIELLRMIALAALALSIWIAMAFFSARRKLAAEKHYNETMTTRFRDQLVEAIVEANPALGGKHSLRSAVTVSEALLREQGEIRKLADKRQEAADREREEHLAFEAEVKGQIDKLYRMTGIEKTRPDIARTGKVDALIFWVGMHSTREKVAREIDTEIDETLVALDHSEALSLHPAEKIRRLCKLSVGFYGEMRRVAGEEQGIRDALLKAMREWADGEWRGETTDLLGEFVNSFRSERERRAKYEGALGSVFRGIGELHQGLLKIGFRPDPVKLGPDGVWEPEQPIAVGVMMCQDTVGRPREFDPREPGSVGAARFGRRTRGGDEGEKVDGPTKVISSDGRTDLPTNVPGVIEVLREAPRVSNVKLFGDEEG